MSVHIIDCEDQQLCFRPHNGTAFRCFYVVSDYGDLDSGLTEFRLLVSVQPDRTAHVMKMSALASDIGGTKTELGERLSASQVWASLLKLAFKALRSEPVAAAYVLDDEFDPAWTAALPLGGLVLEGWVDHFRRPSTFADSGQLLNANPLGIRSIKAATVLDSFDLQNDAERGDAQDGLLEHGHAEPDLTTSVVQLLRHTIRFSEDCLLRTKLCAEDVLALFACNPGDLHLLLASGTDGLVGMLVGDASQGANRGHIEYLGVHSEFRRQSVATLLVDSFQSRVPSSALSVAVHGRNQASVCFFQQQNFSRSEQYQLWTRDI